MKIFVRIMIFIVLFMIVLVLGINGYMIVSTRNRILDIDKLDDEYDCVLVLGAGIRGGKPSHMLEDRLLTALEIYNQGIVKKIIVSGDHGRVEYDEVNVMKDYLISKGVNSSDIFMDHAGFSTYDSVYRVKEIFQVSKPIIVTQRYHGYRALYIAKELDVDAYLVDASRRDYFMQIKREIREILARVKDYFKCILKPESTYLGEVIPISMDGDITNDRN